MNENEIIFLKDLVSYLDKNILQIMVVMTISCFLLKYAWQPLKDSFSGVSNFFYKCFGGIGKYICRGVHIYFWHKHKMRKDREKKENQVVEILKQVVKNETQQGEILSKFTDNQYEMKNDIKKLIILHEGRKLKKNIERAANEE